MLLKQLREQKKPIFFIIYDEVLMVETETQAFMLNGDQCLDCGPETMELMDENADVQVLTPAEAEAQRPAAYKEYQALTA
jgi:hypothetical protein